jgi:hypothetical protein
MRGIGAAKNNLQKLRSVSPLPNWFHNNFSWWKSRILPYVCPKAKLVQSHFTSNS